MLPCILLFSFVFSPGGKTSADMTLRLVQVQQPTDLSVQSRVQLWETFGQIFMDRALGDAELLGGGADGGFVFNDIHGQIPNAFLDICTHIHHSLAARSGPRLSCSMYMKLERGVCKNTNTEASSPRAGMTGKIFSSTAVCAFFDSYKVIALPKMLCYNLQ